VKWLDAFLHSFSKEKAPVQGDPERIAEVERVLAELAPFVESDGGELELVAVRDGWVEVRLRGACADCSSSESTLFGALEPKLRERLTWYRGLRAT
jgi:Fe-S cluster biogenesis protein NfuA